MFRLTSDELKLLANLETIDSILISTFGDEVYLYKNNKIGLYIRDHGIVLEPLYVSIQRFDDLLKVGNKTAEGIRYGAYSVKAKSFVIPMEFTDTNPYGGFWEQYKQISNPRT